MSNACKRFRRFKNRTGLTYHQLAEIFGVEYETVSGWYNGQNGMQADCEATLVRLEGPSPQLSPRIRPETAKAFQMGASV